MATIINSLEAKRLRDISSVEAMLTPEYLSDTKHIQTSFIYDKFFDGKEPVKRQKRLNLLNISYSIPSLLSEIFADFIGMPSTPMELDIDQWLNSFTWGGLSVFKLGIKNGDFNVGWASPDGYVIEDDGTEHLYTWLIELNESGTATRYAFEQIYRPGSIENKLWKMSNQGSRQSKVTFQRRDHDDLNHRYQPFEGTEVDLGTIEATRDFLPMEQTGLARNPLVVVHNTKRGITKYGSSDVLQVRSMMSSIEVQLVNLQDQLLKHLQAKLYLPASKAPIDEEGFVNTGLLEAILMEQGDNPPGYVMNTNPLIDNTFTLIEKLITQIATVLRVPVELMGLQAVKGVESDGTKSKRVAAFIKRIEKAQRKFSTALKEVNEIREELGFEKFEDFDVVWPHSFPVNKLEEVSELGGALDARLISRKKAIMRYQDFETEEEVEAEIDAINEENASIDADDLGV